MGHSPEGLPTCFVPVPLSRLRPEHSRRGLPSRRQDGCGPVLGKARPSTLRYKWAAGGGQPYLTLIQRCVLRLLEDHAEGDTLGVGGEDPADGEACLGHGDGDEAVGAGPYEQLPVALPKVGDLFHREG